MLAEMPGRRNFKGNSSIQMQTFQFDETEKIKGKIKEKKME